MPVSVVLPGVRMERDAVAFDHQALADDHVDVAHTGDEDLGADRDSPTLQEAADDRLRAGFGCRREGEDRRPVPRGEARGDLMDPGRSDEPQVEG